MSQLVLEILDDTLLSLELTGEDAAAELAEVLGLRLTVRCSRDER